MPYVRGTTHPYNQGLGAIPLLDSNLPLEATEAMTRVQERERVMLALVGIVFGFLIAKAWGRG